MSRYEKIKKALNESGLNPDRVVNKRDGSSELRFGFFYRHGRSSQYYAQVVAKSMAGYKVIDSGENWQPWPKDSYFWVTVQEIVPEAAPVAGPAEAVASRVASDFMRTALNRYFDADGELLTDKQLKFIQKVAHVMGLPWQAIAARQNLTQEVILDAFERGFSAQKAADEVAEANRGK